MEYELRGPTNKLPEAMLTDLKLCVSETIKAMSLREQFLAMAARIDYDHLAAQKTIVAHHIWPSIAAKVLTNALNLFERRNGLRFRSDYRDVIRSLYLEAAPRKHELALLTPHAGSTAFVEGFQPRLTLHAYEPGNTPLMCSSPY